MIHESKQQDIKGKTMAPSGGKKCVQWPSYQPPEQQKSEANLVKPSEPEIIDTSEGIKAIEQKKLVATNLKCSICSLVLHSIEDMKTHVESAHGLKLKLRVVNSSRLI